MTLFRLTRRIPFSYNYLKAYACNRADKGVHTGWFTFGKCNMAITHFDSTSSTFGTYVTGTERSKIIAVYPDEDTVLRATWEQVGTYEKTVVELADRTPVEWVSSSLDICELSVEMDTDGEALLLSTYSLYKWPLP